MLDKIEGRIQDWFNQSSDLQENIREEVIQIIESNYPEFRSYLANLDYTESLLRDVIYDAIQFKPQGKDELIKQEITNLLKHTHGGNKYAKSLMPSIMYLTKLEGMSNIFYESVILVLEKNLTSDIQTVKIECQEAILDVLAEIPYYDKGDLVKKLQSMLQDPNLKVRLHTFINLQQSDLLPRNFKLKTIDKIRGKLKGYSYL